MICRLRSTNTDPPIRTVHQGSHETFRTKRLFRGEGRAGKEGRKEGRKKGRQDAGVACTRGGDGPSQVFATTVCFVLSHSMATAFHNRVRTSTILGTQLTIWFRSVVSYEKFRKTFRGASVRALPSLPSLFILEAGEEARDEVLLNHLKYVLL